MPVWFPASPGRTWLPLSVLRLLTRPLALAPRRTRSSQQSLGFRRQTAGRAPRTAVALWCRQNPNESGRTHKPQLHAAALVPGGWSSSILTQRDSGELVKLKVEHPTVRLSCNDHGERQRRPMTSDGTDTMPTRSRDFLTGPQDGSSVISAEQPASWSRCRRRDRPRHCESVSRPSDIRVRSGNRVGSRSASVPHSVPRQMTVLFSKFIPWFATPATRWSGSYPTRRCRGGRPEAAQAICREKR